MQVAIGTYVGTGASQTITTTLTAAPVLVLIKGNTAQDACLRLAGFVGDATKDLFSTNVFTLGIASLNAGGTFTVTSDARCNGNGITYYYLAVAAGVGSAVAGSYIGDNTVNRSITGVGFLPDLVLIARYDATSGLRWIDAAQPSGKTTWAQDFTHAATAGTTITATADGFQVSGNPLNTSSGQYAYLCLKADSRHFGVLAYTGNATTATTIGGFGFLPDFVLTKDFTTSDTSVVKFKDEAITNSIQISASVEQTGLLTSMATDGFIVSNSTTVNRSAAIYTAFAFKVQGTVAPWTPLFATHIRTTDVVTNTGSNPIYPQWSVVGPGYYLILKNTTMGQTWTLPYRVGAGETVTINFDPTQKTVSSSVAGDISSSVLAGSAWWSLSSGDTNISLEFGQTMPQSTITLLRIPR